MSRLVNYINESAMTLKSTTTKGFSEYEEMEKNNLFIEKSGARRWQMKGDLITTVYAYDGVKMVGWSAIKYLPTPKGSQNYGKVVAGIVGVFVDPLYRNKGVARLLMNELKQKIDYSKKTPIGKFMDKYKIWGWSIEIRHEKRITELVTSIFNDITEYDDPQYTCWAL